MVNLRSEAAKSLQRAKTELNTGDVNRLKYAALELRMAMEAIIYSNAQSFKDDLTENEKKVWQPKRLLKHLISLTPSADKSLSVSVNGKMVGTETKLSIRDIDRPYHKLSSYLHMPSLADIESDANERQEKLKDHCFTIIKLLTDVLASPVFGIVLKDYVTLKQCGRCDEPIKILFDRDSGPKIIRCRSCEAPYEVANGEDKTTNWRQLKTKIPCQNKSCNVDNFIWKDEIKVGTNWACRACGTEHLIHLSAVKKEGAKFAS